MIHAAKFIDGFAMGILVQQSIMGLYHCIYRVDKYIVDLVNLEVYHTLEQAVAMWFMCNHVSDFDELIELG